MLFYSAIFSFSSFSSYFSPFIMLKNKKKFFKNFFVLLPKKFFYLKNCFLLHGKKKFSIKIFLILTDFFVEIKNVS